MSKNLKEIVNQLQGDLIEYRRYFHTHPELGTFEYNTSEYIQQRLSEFSIPFTRMYKTGIVGIVEGTKNIIGGSVRTIAIRADMDALPINEENEVPYRSKNPGIMHACGHDGHMAILLGLAKVLSMNKAEFQGKVLLIFQPDEEGLGGAQPMIEEYDFSEVEHFFGLHLDNSYPCGIIGIRKEYCSGTIDDLEITIKGKGGHAAYPHLSLDPVVASAELIQGLQLVRSRFTNPFEPVVLTIGSISGGTKHNIIPPEVKLQGTLRTMNNELRRELLIIINKICEGVSLTSGTEIILNSIPGYPSIYNDSQLADKISSLFTNIFNQENVVLARPGLGGEDFSYFAQLKPSFFYRIGSSMANKQVYPHHHPLFDIDEGSLKVGLLSLASIVFNFLD